MRRIDELQLLPGRERSLHVCYTPAAPSNEDEGGAVGDTAEADASVLTRRAFRLDLKGVASSKGGVSSQPSNGTERREVHSRIVQCRARVCASMLAVPAPVHNFGDCDIQTLKVANVLVKNLSDLPTQISISMHSKALSTTQTTVLIGPRSSHELRFNFVPRRVNPSYRKEVTITNLNNAGDEHVVEFVSNNVDRHNISFHSLFYKLALLRPAEHSPRAGLRDEPDGGAALAVGRDEADEGPGGGTAAATF
jgi:hypothetical protein